MSRREHRLRFIIIPRMNTNEHARMNIPAPIRSCLPSLRFLLLLAALAPASAPAALGDDSVAIGGQTYVNKGLVGVGRIPADLRDKFGETFGSGSGLAVDPRSWTRTPTGY